MHQLHNFGDERQTEGCAHCGRETATRDHIPPRIFLDQPYPENLPIVAACESCNNEASDDEEYTACVIDCALTGTVDEHAGRRQKIARALDRQPALKARIAASVSECGGTKLWHPDLDRVYRVMVKIARGLAVFELNEPRLEAPAFISVVPLSTMADVERSAFENIAAAATWPEIGSRAMQRLLIDDDGPAGWIIVQNGRFRYATIWEGSDTIVRMVCREYLGAKVVWQDA